MMGSGGMVVMDETSCMPAIAKFYLEFTCEESCGKCSPCRIGNKRLCELLEKITNGNGTMDDLYALRNLAAVIKDSALCGLGQTSPNPVLSTLDNFWDEYVEHVVDKKCRAGVCKKLMQYVIDSSTPRSASAAASAPRTAPPRPSPAPTTSLPATSWLRWSSVRRSASSAAPATRTVSLVPSRLNNL